MYLHAQSEDIECWTEVLHGTLSQNYQSVQLLNQAYGVADEIGSLRGR